MTTYQIQRVTIATDGTNMPAEGAPYTLEVEFESTDHDVIMRNWSDYCSGLNDYDGPHYDASFTARPAAFYRIVAVEG